MKPVRMVVLRLTVLEDIANTSYKCTGRRFGRREGHTQREGRSRRTEDSTKQQLHLHSRFDIRYNNLKTMDNGLQKRCFSPFKPQSSTLHPLTPSVAGWSHNRLADLCCLVRPLQRTLCVLVSAMSTIDRFLIKLNAQISQWVLPSTLKKVVTVLVLAASIYYAYDRISRNRRRQAQHRTLTIATTANTQRQLLHSGSAALRAPSTSNATLASSSAASSSPVNRLLNTLASSSSTQLKDSLPLTPSEKYLTAPSVPPRLVVVATAGIVFSRSNGGSPAIVALAVPVLAQLARCCQLVLVTQMEAENSGAARESEVRRLLQEAGLMAAGLREHRVLFCSTAKGKVAIIRHLQPALAVDSDAEVVSLVRPHIVDVVHVTPAAPTASAFTPPTLTAANKLPPASASAAGGRSAAAERKVHSVPTLDMFFHGTTRTADVQ